MKRKFTFFGICVLICTLMISLGSCQKDYSEDIADLQAQITANQNAITALNSAIASGKLIKTVATTSTGYTITFSDNTTISLNHGTNGTPGTPGTPGATGPAGATGFTPIIGIDADGYWTVVTTQGGTPARILVDGLPVFAKFTTDQFGANAQGFITINGVATSVYVPIIAYNDVTKKLQVTIKNADGTFSTYSVAVDENTFLRDDVVSIISPIGMSKVVIGFGNVPANNAAGYDLIRPQFAPGATKAQADAALTYAGLAYGQLVQSSGKLPLIINPAQAVLTGYKFEIIKKDGSLYTIQPNDAVETGYDLPFAQFAAAPSNGLYSLVLEPTAAAATLAAAAALYPAGYPGGAVGESYELAVRATKNGREVFSGYQYAVKVQQYTPVVYAPKATVDVTAGWPTVYVPIGTTKNLLDYYDKTAPAPTATLANSHFYKAGIKIMPGNSDIEPLISYTLDYGTTVTTTTTTTTVTNLNDKKVPFTLKTFDRAATYLESQIDVVFFSTLRTGTTATYTLPAISHVLTAAATPADQKDVLLTPSLFASLDAVGKTELWRNQATNVEVKLTYVNSAGATVNIPGVTYEFRDANNVAIAQDAAGTWGPILNVVGKVQDIRRIVFTFNEALALPGTYNAVMQFTDRRPHANTAAQMFTVNIPVTIENPTIASIATATDKKANVFNGQVLTVYGTSAVAPVQNIFPQYYDIHNAYVNLSTAAAPAAPLVPVANWGFVFDLVAPATTPSALLSTTLAGNNKERFNFGSALVGNTTIGKPYVNYSVKLFYYFFGNTANKQLLETITVIAKSEIKEGNKVDLTPLAATGLPATMQVTNGDLATVRNFLPYYRINDYLGTNLNLFAAGRDTRAVTVTATAPATLAHLISITVNGNDFDVKATNNVAELPTAFVDIPVKLEITDKFDVKTEYSLNVRVVKP